MGSSKNLLMVTSPLRLLQRRVLTMNFLAKWLTGCGSSGFIMTLLSSGSPGTIWSQEKMAVEKEKLLRSKLRTREQTCQW
jgi:hypothetical protein